MLALSDVTLCCIDTANHALALRALARSREGLSFARTLFLTDRPPREAPVPPEIEVALIAPLTSRDAYSDFVLKSLSKETGGRAYTVVDIKQLPQVYSQIADELANQYTLAYVSKNSKRDGAWRKINVQISRGGMTARTKAGYFGPKGLQ